MEYGTYKLVGLTPLLMHNPSSMKAADPGVGKKRIPTPEQEAEAGLYRLANGQLYLPAIAVRSCLLRSCTGKRIGKTSARTCASAGVFTTELELVVMDATTGKPIKTWEVLTVRAMIQRQGILRSRPMIRNWAIIVKFEIDTDFIRPEHVFELLTYGGKAVGLGDWRPEKTGMYGRFEVQMMD